MSNVPTEFVNLIPPSSTKPKFQWFKADTPVFGPLTGRALNFLRDQLNISTWLSLGAILQASAYLAFGRLAFLPAVGLVAYRVLDAYLMSVGVKKNPYMDGVILNKFAAALPDDEGRFGNTPAREGVVCFLIGARCNHPMGMFGPGFKQLGDFFQKMAKECEENPEEYGVLGMSAWLSNGERTTNNEILNVMYFKNVEGLHKFAHGPKHREGWNWWNKNISKLPHISIWHEIYAAPTGRWEAIYANSHPTGLSAATKRVEMPASEKEAAQTAWFSPIVDARKGVLKTSAGRMQMSKGDDNDKYDDPYGNYSA